MGCMNSAVTGEVLFNDEPNKHQLYRFCEKKIDQWLKAQLGEQVPTEESPVEFRVSFNEEDGRPGQVSCTTEIVLKGQHALYRGWDLASDTQQAFMHSLKRLQPH